MVRPTVDQTVARVAQLVKDQAPKHERGGYTWYDVTDQDLSKEVTLLRVSGVIAHHPTVRTLIRFED